MQAFPAGRQAREIYALWHTAQQKVLLDETWLATLLARAQASPRLKPGVEAPGTPLDTAPLAVGPRLDWGEALAVPNFYWRQWELSLLAGWVVEGRCRVLSLVGLSGTSKSVLAITLMHRVAEQFEAVIWRSLRDLPSHEVLLEDLLQVLMPQALGEAPANLEGARPSCWNKCATVPSLSTKAACCSPAGRNSLILWLLRMTTRLCVHYASPDWK